MSFGCGCGNVAGAQEQCGPGGILGARDKCKPGELSFLLLLTLFILMASCVTSGIEKNFFFIIILAVIAFGGCGRTFFGANI
ncbi:MAG: hypothetical protein M0P77_02445 [Firmicutes bacterium]|nr:hypothetical protein [Bacillota bacterium]